MQLTLVSKKWWSHAGVTRRVPCNIGKRHTIGIRADSQTHPRLQFVCVISCHSKLMWCNLLGYKTYRYYACCAQMLTVAVWSSVCKRSLSHTVPSPQDYAWYDKIAGSINVQPHSVRPPQALHFRSIMTLWKDIATAWILHCHTKISLFGLSRSVPLSLSLSLLICSLWQPKSALSVQKCFKHQARTPFCAATRRVTLEHYDDTVKRYSKGLNIAVSHKNLSLWPLSFWSTAYYHIEFQKGEKVSVAGVQWGSWKICLLSLSLEHTKTSKVSVCLCDLLPLQMNVVESNTLYNLKSYYTCSPQNLTVRFWAVYA